MRDAAWFVGALVVTGLLLVALAPRDLAISLALADHRGGAFGYIVQEWGRKPASVLIILAAVVLTSRSLRLAHPLWTRASAAVAAHLLVQSALITNVVKLLTGRPRPLRLGPGGEGFAAFWRLHPGFGDFAFPSGHVAIAMILAPIAVLLWRERRRLAALGVALLTAGWAGLMAFGRVAYGAHFPTDAAFSIGLGIALAPLSLRIGDWFVGKLARKGPVA